MAGIILTILKIIGILLLFIIACIIVIITAVLFLPVNYALKAEKNDDNTNALLNLNWFFHLFRIQIFYNLEDGFTYYFKIFFFQIFPKKEKPDKKEKSGNTKKKQKAKKGSIQKEDMKREDTKQKVTQEMDKTESSIKRNAEEKENFSQISSIEKETHTAISDFFEIIKKKIIKLKFTFQKICDKIKKIPAEYEKFKKFILGEEIKEFLNFFNQQCRYLFRHLKPKKADIYACFGTDDPAVTGEVLAMLSFIFPFYPWNLNIVPDFEHTCFEINIDIKGKVQFFVIFNILWRSYRNKNIKKFIKAVTQ